MSTSRPRAWDDATPPSAAAPPAAAGPSASPSAAAPNLEAAERAAAIAAKLGQSLRPSAPGGGGSSASPNAGGAPRPARNDFDGEFTHDIEVNDLRNRYLLTKGSTQAQLLADTGASVVTKGTWLPDKSKATAADPPLYLHVVAQTKEILDKALAAIQVLIDQDLGALTEDRSQWARNRERFGQGPPGTGANAAAPGQPGGPVDNGFGQRGERRKWPEVKLPIEVETIRNFNVRAKVVGPGGLFVKHIQNETGTRVQIKGHGSGFYDQETGREADEPMHISISGPDEAMVEKAKLLGEDLLLVVRSEFEKASAAHNAGHGASYGMPMGGMGMGGPPGPGGYGGGYGGPQQQHQQQQGGYYGYQQAQQPPQPQGDAPPPPPGEDAPPPPPDDGTAPPSGVPATGGAAPAAGAPGGPTGPETAEQKAYREYWAAYGYDINDPAFQAWQAQTYYAQQAAAAGGAAPAGGAPGAPGGQPQQQQQGSPPRGGSGVYGAVPPPAGL